jgi:outer membrane protein TolC
MALLPAAALPMLAQTATKPETVAAAPATNAAPLELKDCVLRALQKNFDIKIQDFSTQNARESLIIADANFAPLFGVSATRSGDRNYVSLLKTDQTDTRASVSQNLTTGATVSLTSLLSRTGTNPLYTNPNPAYNSDLTLSVSQPLLKGLGTAVNKAAIERARIGVEKAGLDFRTAVLQVVYNVEAAYYNLCYAREQMIVKQHTLDLANTLYNEAKVRRESGVATQLDELQAEVGIANARLGLLQANQAIKDREDALMALIGQFELGTPVGSVRFPEDLPADPSFDASYKLARDNQPSLLSAYALQKQYQIDTVVAKNGRLPSLNLDAAYGYNAREKTIHESINELPGSEGRSWQVGLSLSVPWGLKAERAKYRSALNVASQNQTRISQLEQNLMANVRTAVRTVLTDEESVIIAAKATELSNGIYEREKSRFSTGTSTARRVLEAQNDLENARISELQTRVSLRNAISALRLLEGSSLGYYQIPLP